MLGLGETKDEVLQVMDDLLSANVDFPWSMWAIIEKFLIFMKNYNF